MERKLKLLPINPFTRRQREVIELLIEGVTSRKEMAKRLYLSPYTVRTHIAGIITSAGPSGDDNLNKTSLGISGIIERATGKASGKREQIIANLVGDVVILTQAND